MAKIYLVRHGETDWNRERRVLGWSKVPLNVTGRSQAKELADLLPTFKITRIDSSPLPRTLQTAEILGASLGLTPIVEPRFIEANVGSWEGRYWKELEMDPVQQQYYAESKTARPPNGETLWEVQQRVAAGLATLHHQQRDGRFLVVTHADVIRCLLSHYLGIDLKIVKQLRIDHASLSLMSLDEKGTVLEFLNFTADRSRFDE